MRVLAITSKTMLHHSARDPTPQPVATQQLIGVWNLPRRAATLHAVVNETCGEDLMSAVLKDAEVVVTNNSQTETGWCNCLPGLDIKVLAVDAARHSVDYLARATTHYQTGRHKHHCDSFIYVLEGAVTNHTIGVTFKQGDFCFQPAGDVHDEEVRAEDGLITHVSLRGTAPLLLEYFDDTGAVCSRFTVQDFLDRMR